MLLKHLGFLPQGQRWAESPHRRYPQWITLGTGIASFGAAGGAQRNLWLCKCSPWGLHLIFPWKFEQMRGRKPLVCKSFCCGVKDFIKPGQSSSLKTTPSASLKWQQHSFSGAILTQPLLSSPQPCSKSTRNRIWWLPKPNLIPSRQQLRERHDLHRYRQLERCSSASRSLLMQRWQRGDPNLDILGKCTPSSTKKEASSSELHL